MKNLKAVLMGAAILLALSGAAHAQDDDPLAPLHQELMDEIDRMAPYTAEMVDMVFSFGELGFQEFETSRYLTGILRRNGFNVEEGVAGIPTAWVATWGSGKPVISFGSDIDGIPKASQKPGVAYHDPIIEGAPGHGEGHNSGQSLNITAALALKKIMEREGITGTLMLWPGVAEELVATKAYFVREGLFEDVDMAFFTHISSSFGVGWGQAGGSGLISVEYTFHGESAHAAGSPWRGRSALDAVELMTTAWNYRREHLRVQQRSHYVISNGGDQPNVVPSLASVWFYFRELEYPRIKELYEIGNRIAEGAAMMTDTEVDRRVLGSAWPRHFNKVIAETMAEKIEMVGMPEWSEDDQTLARALQEEISGRGRGLSDRTRGLSGPVTNSTGGGSDDIGDISWTVPTVTLRFPSNIPGITGHHWSSAVAMATPIAHKGATAGAKALAMTALEFFMKPELVEEAWAYFNDVQSEETTYTPLIEPGDRPAIHLNKKILDEFRPEMRKFYYDPSRYSSYLEQLGIQYPTIRK